MDSEEGEEEETHVTGGSWTLEKEEEEEEGEEEEVERTHVTAGTAPEFQLWMGQTNCGWSLN